MLENRGNIIKILNILLNLNKYKFEEIQLKAEINDLSLVYSAINEANNLITNANIGEIEINLSGKVYLKTKNIEKIILFIKELEETENESSSDNKIDININDYPEFSQKDVNVLLRLFYNPTGNTEKLKKSIEYEDSKELNKYLRKLSGNLQYEDIGQIEIKSFKYKLIIDDMNSFVHLLLQYKRELESITKSIFMDKIDSTLVYLNIYENIKTMEMLCNKTGIEKNELFNRITLISKKLSLLGFEELIISDQVIKFNKNLGNFVKVIELFSHSLSNIEFENLRIRSNISSIENDNKLIEKSTEDFKTAVNAKSKQIINIQNIIEQL